MEAVGVFNNHLRFEGQGFAGISCAFGKGGGGAGAECFQVISLGDFEFSLVLVPGFGAVLASVREFAVHGAGSSFGQLLGKFIGVLESLKVFDVFRSKRCRKPILVVDIADGVIEEVLHGLVILSAEFSVVATMLVTNFFSNGFEDSGGVATTFGKGILIGKVLK